MTQKEIVIIAPNLKIAETANRVLEKNGNDCRVLIAGIDSLSEVSRQQAELGAVILIAFGMFAKIVRQSVSIPVIMVDIEEEDIIDAILYAATLGRRVAIMGFRKMVDAIFRIQPILRIDLIGIPTALPEDVPTVLQNHRDIDVLVGGHYQTEIAEKIGIKTVVIEPKEKEIEKAIFMARSYLAAEDKKTADEEFSLMESSVYAVMSVDCFGNIMALNKLAADYLGVSHLTAVSFTLDSVCPQLTRVTDAIANRRAYLNQIATVNNRTLLYHVEPIWKGTEIEGTTITFQDINTVIGSEISIRRKIINKENQVIYSFEDIIGGSRCLTRALTAALKYSRTDETVLILGETGTGKELFAQGIHRASLRKDRPFVAINCASLPESILESELFGYVKGAFTGATKEGKRGLFEVAHTGSIFLDEIGEISLALQGKLLRVLQERNIRRLGDDKQIPVDIRVIAATNKDLISMVREGKFRDDLYFRINVLCLEVPPLRQRERDILLLAKEFLEEASIRNKRKYYFSSEAEAALMQYRWPGNVRELQNFIRRATVTSETEKISQDVVLDYIQENRRLYCVKEETLHNPKAYTLEEALKLTGNNKKKAAELLGISRATLYRMIERRR